MARRLTEPELIVASHNPGKVREIGALVAPRGIRAVSAAELGLPEPAETGATFRANAELKAKAAAARAGKPALADDSGLAVAALGGAPGIYSARWAGGAKDFGLAMRKVEGALLGKTDRRAAFVCALSLAWPDGHAETFDGRIEGTLVFPPRGERGFGYDPIFVPEGGAETFGEMAPEEKHRISHRALAFAKLAAACLPQAA